jgi:hypothetical protein
MDAEARENAKGIPLQKILLGNFDEVTGVGIAFFIIWR